MKILLTILLLLPIRAEAGFKQGTDRRGEFTSNGYVMYHQRNDHKTRGTGYQGYQPQKYRPYQPYSTNNYYIINKK